MEKENIENMIKAIEGNTYKISKSKGDAGEGYIVEIKDNGLYLLVFKEEVDELIELLSKAKEIL